MCRVVCLYLSKYAIGLRKLSCYILVANASGGFVPMPIAAVLPLTLSVTAVNVFSPDSSFFVVMRIFEAVRQYLLVPVKHSCSFSPVT